MAISRRRTFLFAAAVIIVGCGLFATAHAVIQSRRRTELAAAVSAIRHGDALALDRAIKSGVANDRVDVSRARPWWAILSRTDRSARTRPLITLACDRRVIPMSLRSSVDLVRVLIAHGAKVDAPDLNGKSALMEAAYNLDLPTVEVLLSHEASPNAVDAEGFTPLLWALNRRSPRGRIQVISLLLKRGARTDVSGDGFAPLNLTTNPVEAALLIASGADVNHAVINSGITPLMMAAGRGDLRLVRLLISKGANRSAFDLHGRSVTYWADNGLRAASRGAVIAAIADSAR